MITIDLIKEFLNYGSCLSRFSYKNIPITLFYDTMKGSGFERWLQYTLMSFLQGVYRNSVIYTEYPILNKSVDLAKGDKVTNRYGGNDFYVSLVELKCVNAQHTSRGIEDFMNGVYRDVEKLDKLCANGVAGNAIINSAETLCIIVHEQVPANMTPVRASVNGNPVKYDTACFDIGGHNLFFEIIVIPKITNMLSPTPLIRFNQTQIKKEPQL